MFVRPEELTCQVCTSDWQGWRKQTAMGFLKSLTPDFFSTLVIVFIIIGLALAIVRLYADFTRPLPPDDEGNEDTRPNPVVPDNDNSKTHS